MTEKQKNQLSRALAKRFVAKVVAEEAGRKGRYRFDVVSKQFSGVAHLKRQDDIWEVVDEVLPRDARVDVSLILAYSPDELAAA